MKLQSCQNCWFNGLQYGSIGLTVGYCTRHRKVLNLSDETTCGLHIRKDLGLNRADEIAITHSQFYESDKIVRLSDKMEIESDASGSEKDSEVLRKDTVGEAVVDYGYLNSKIESLAQLKSINTARSDVAMTSLGRAYVKNCVSRGGRWTSGLHLYWWTKKQLSDVPYIHVEDIRYSGSIQLSRQIELAAWSLMMLKLSFIDDIIDYAGKQNDEVGRETGITNNAALAVQDFNVRKLSAWIRKELVPALESRLDYKRYSALARELHQE